MESKIKYKIAEAQNLINNELILETFGQAFGFHPVIGGSMELISITGFAILLFALVALCNASRAIQQSLHFNRPMPFVDGSSLGLLLIGGVLFSLQGLLDFKATDYLSESMAYVLFILVGVSAVWQATRQR